MNNFFIIIKLKSYLALIIYSGCIWHESYCWGSNWNWNFSGGLCTCTEMDSYYILFSEGKKIDQKEKIISTSATGKRKHYKFIKQSKRLNEWSQWSLGSFQYFLKDFWKRFSFLFFFWKIFLFYNIFHNNQIKHNN